MSRRNVRCPSEVRPRSNTVIFLITEQNPKNPLPVLPIVENNLTPNCTGLLYVKNSKLLANCLHALCKIMSTVYRVFFFSVLITFFTIQKKKNNKNNLFLPRYLIRDHLNICHLYLDQFYLSASQLHTYTIYS